MSTKRFPHAPYEIEFRCRFATDDDAFRALPFLRSSLVHSVSWTDAYYGLELFSAGEVLRFSSLLLGDEPRYYLGWKGVDRGAFANLRQELGEDVTSGTVHSAILAAFADESGPCGLAEVAPTLESAGHAYFMSYEGESITGRDEALAVNTKLMRCAALRWPLLVEIEKLAETEAEARRSERELLDICREYRLEAHLVSEEPGTLLYEKVFGEPPASVRRAPKA